MRFLGAQRLPIPCLWVHHLALHVDGGALGGREVGVFRARVVCLRQRGVQGVAVGRCDPEADIRKRNSATPNTRSFGGYG